MDYRQNFREKVKAFSNASRPTGAINQVKGISNVVGASNAANTTAIPSLHDSGMGSDFMRKQVYDRIDKVPMLGNQASKIGAGTRAILKKAPVLGVLSDTGSAVKNFSEGNAVAGTYDTVNAAANAAMLSKNPTAMAIGGAYGAGRGVGSIANWGINKFMQKSRDAAVAKEQDLNSPELAAAQATIDANKKRQAIAEPIPKDPVQSAIDKGLLSKSAIDRGRDPVVEPPVAAPVEAAIPDIDQRAAQLQRLKDLGANGPTSQEILDSGKANRDMGQHLQAITSGNNTWNLDPSQQWEMAKTNMAAQEKKRSEGDVNAINMAKVQADRYGHDQTLSGQKYTADQGLSGHKYTSDRDLEGKKLANVGLADLRSAEAAKHRSDSAKSTKETENIVGKADLQKEKLTTDMFNHAITANSKLPESQQLTIPEIWADINASLQGKQKKVIPEQAAIPSGWFKAGTPKIERDVQYVSPTETKPANMTIGRFNIQH